MIDDEVVLLRSYDRSLRKLFDVVTVKGGEEAIELLERDRDFDVIVCDLSMPRVNGAGVYAYLEKSAPELLPRLIFCSGGPHVQSVELSKWLDRIDNLRLLKPVELKVLRATIAQVRDDNAVIG